MTKAIRFDLIADPRKWNQGFNSAEQRSGKFASGIFSLAKRLAGPAALGAVGLAALEVGTKFQEASNTIRVGTGATGKALKGLEGDFRKVYAGVPGSAEDAATAIADLNTRTGQSGKGLQALARNVLNLTRITKTDLGENIAATTRLFGDWSIKTNKQADALDELFRASQATGASVTTLAQEVVQFGSPLRQLGFNLETTLALFGEFEKTGVNIETVLPGLRFGLKTFAQAGKEPAVALVETIKRIKEAGSVAEANKIAFKTFGVRAGPDLAAAIREGHFDLQALINTIKGGSDTIAKASADTLTWRDKLELLRKKLEVFAAPSVTAVFDALDKKITGLEEFVRVHLAPKLGDLKKAWDDNKASIGALLNPLDTAAASMGSADENAQRLADTLTQVVEAAGKIARAASATGLFLDDLSLRSQRWGLQLHGALLIASIGFVTAAATTAQALDNIGIAMLKVVRYSLGVFDPNIRKAADAGIRALQDMRDKTRQHTDAAILSLGNMRAATARNVREMQREIDRLHGKTVKIKVDWEHPHAGLAGLSVKIMGGPMATGGLVRGPGGPRDDRAGLFALSDGEFVVNAAAASRNRGLLEAINAGRMADGGFVGTLRYFQRLQADMDPLARRVGMAYGRAISRLGGPIQSFIRAADRLPYVWGGVGPGGYDCSGLTGEVYARMRHLPSYRRYFTTASDFRALGFAPGGGGMYQIGVDRAAGHMAGRYAGLGFEAANTRAGIRVGAAARNVNSFPAVYHMAQGGLVGGVGGRLAAALAGLPGIFVGGDPARLRIGRYDAGGLLPPGLSLAYNGTGRPEPVGGGVDYDRLAAAVLRGMDGARVQLDGRTVGRLLTPHVRSGLKAAQGREGIPPNRQIR